MSLCLGYLHFPFPVVFQRERRNLLRKLARSSVGISRYLLAFAGVFVCIDYSVTRGRSIFTGCMPAYRFDCLPARPCEIHELAKRRCKNVVETAMTSIYALNVANCCRKSEGGYSGGDSPPFEKRDSVLGRRWGSLRRRRFRKGSLLRMPSFAKTENEPI